MLVVKTACDRKEKGKHRCSCGPYCIPGSRSRPDLSIEYGRIKYSPAKTFFFWPTTNYREEVTLHGNLCSLKHYKEIESALCDLSCRKVNGSRVTDGQLGAYLEKKGWSCAVMCTSFFYVMMLPCKWLADFPAKYKWYLCPLEGIKSGIGGPSACWFYCLSAWIPMDPRSKEGKQNIPLKRKPWNWNYYHTLSRHLFEHRVWKIRKWIWT